MGNFMLGSSTFYAYILIWKLDLIWSDVDLASLKIEFDEVIVSMTITFHIYVQNDPENMWLPACWWLIFCDLLWPDPDLDLFKYGLSAHA